MNLLAWIAIVALGALTVFVVGDLLDPGTVPVAGAVELTGSAPESSPPAEGFFIVPPRVVDLRGQQQEDDDTSPDPSSAGGESDGFEGTSADDSPDVAGDVDDSPDDLDDSDESADEPGDPDDSVDDDD